MDLTYQDGYDDYRNGTTIMFAIYKTLPDGDRILTSYGYGWNQARLGRKSPHVGRDWRYEKFLPTM